MPDRPNGKVRLLLILSSKDIKLDDLAESYGPDKQRRAASPNKLC